MTLVLAASAYTARGCAARCWGPSAWPCTTSFCHVLGGTWNLPHAETHTVVLPHTLAYNRSFAPEAVKRVAPVILGLDVPGASIGHAVRILDMKPGNHSRHHSRTSPAKLPFDVG
jgi:maleylacetate reductase